MSLPAGRRWWHPGSEDFLRVIGDHEHPRHQELLTWVGGMWDLEAFDLAAVNRKLARLR